jgi:hypothetical protein
MEPRRAERLLTGVKLFHNFNVLAGNNEPHKVALKPESTGQHLITNIQRKPSVGVPQPVDQGLP